MQQNLNIEKILFKVVQMKFTAMHITNQKLSFGIFTVGHLLNIFMEHNLNNPNDFWHKIKINNFDPYNIFLSIATNIPVLLLCSRVTFVRKCRKDSNNVKYYCNLRFWFSILIYFKMLLFSVM